MSQLWRHDVAQLREGLGDGAFSAAQVVASLAERSGEWPTLGAWAATAFEQSAREAEDLCDQSRGLPLGGIPFAAKDIIASRSIPTSFGVLPPADFGVDEDAWILRRAKESGALLLGKTASTAFAGGDPAHTLNPWHRERTPGGSSAGSAAGVAAGLVPVAIGTQTAGSVLRPAAYCGVVGFKPSFGLLSTDGIFPFAASLDTVGLIGRSVADIRIFLEALAGPRASADGTDHGTTFVHLRLPTMTSSFVAQHVERVVDRLREAGASVEEANLPVDPDLVLDAHRVIVHAEAFRVHRELFERQPRLYGPQLSRVVKIGALIPPEAYAGALRLQIDLSAQMDALTGHRDIYVLPTVAAGAAGRETTGDPRLQAIATTLGMPALTVPTGRDAAGMPVGTQFLARRGADPHALSIGEWVEEVLGTRVTTFPEPFTAV